MKNKILIIVVFVLMSTVFFLTLRGTAKTIDSASDISHTQKTGPFESSHERSTYATLIALHETGSPVLTRPLANFGVPDVGLYHNKLLSFFPLGLPYLLYPLFLFGIVTGLGQIATYFTIILFSVGNTILIYFIIRKIFKASLSAGLMAALIYALATPGLSYAATIYQHQVTVFFLLLTIFLSSHLDARLSRMTKNIMLVSIFIIYLSAIFVDFVNLVLFLPIILFVLFSWFKKRNFNKIRITLIIGGIFLGIISLLFLYNHATTGTWNKFSNTIPRYRGANIIGTKDAQGVQIQPRFHFLYLFSPVRIPKNLVIELFSPYRGLFFFSPILLIGVYELFHRRKRLQPIEKIFLLTSILCILIYGSYVDPWGGWAFGPRYLIPVMAFLSLYVGLWFERVTSLPYRLFGYSLIIVSVSTALIGAFTTSAIAPPKESLAMHLSPYPIVYTFSLLKHNLTSSYIYRTFFSHSLSLFSFVLVIWLFSLIIIGLTILITPNNK
jgi:hypothetical protein